MDHLLVSKVLEETYVKRLLLMPMLNSNPWPFLSLEIELLIYPLMIFLETEVSSEMVLKKKCKSSLTDGVSGLRPVKFRMSRFHQEVYLLIFRLNLERRVEWTLKRFQLTLKTQFLKKNLLEILNSTEDKLKQIPNKKSILLSKL